jgi:hypothetical protein
MHQPEIKTPDLFVAGGHLTLVGPINALVHILMYAYYFTTAMWPEYKNILWWKKRLTQMQMVRHIFANGRAIDPAVS